MKLPESSSADETPVQARFAVSTAAVTAPAKRLLGRVVFGPSAPVPDEVPTLWVRATTLRPETVESWESPTPVRRVADGAVSYALNADVLFGVWRGVVGPGTIIDVTQLAYRALFEVLVREGYPHLLRVWNYCPDIHRQDGGLDRYQRFCVGRQQAYDGTAFAAQWPAATAVGVSGNELAIAFLAARSRPVPMENPRQVSAYRYPEVYSPRPPMFARATVMDWPRERQVYVSGTASIVGHETRHPRVLPAQLEETLINLATVLTGVEPPGATPEGVMGRIRLARVYLRDPRQWPVVEARLREVLARDVGLMAVSAEICRDDLEIEIEAMATVPR